MGKLFLKSGFALEALEACPSTRAIWRWIFLNCVRKVQKVPILSWRQSHPYILALRPGFVHVVVSKTVVIYFDPTWGDDSIWHYFSNVTMTFKIISRGAVPSDGLSGGKIKQIRHWQRQPQGWSCLFSFRKKQILLIRFISCSRVVFLKHHTVKRHILFA